MKKLTNDQNRIDLVARLVKEGAIDFNEAIKLLEVEVEKEYISYPTYPVYPDWWNRPYWYAEMQNPTITYTDNATTDFVVNIADEPRLFTYTGN
jgi:hypothetical protein